MPVVLAADTATDQCSVAVCDEAGAIAAISFRGKRAHAERLPGTMDDALRYAGVSLDGIDLFAISQGPGSFTGLRIGAAAWKGLAFATRRPLVGVPTLEALARNAAHGGLPVCALIDAKMDEMYGAWFVPDGDGLARATPDCVAPLDAVLALRDGPACLVGDGALRHADHIRRVRPDARIAPPDLAHPCAAAVGAIGLALWAAGAPADPALFAPVYLRRSQAEENAARRAAAP